MKNNAFQLLLISGVIGANMLLGQSQFDVKKQRSGSVPQGLKAIPKINGTGGASHNRVAPGAGVQNTLKSLTSSYRLSHPYKSVKVLSKNNDGLPRFIETIPSAGQQRLGVVYDLREANETYLNDLAPILKLDDPNSQFKINMSGKDAATGFGFVRMDQFVQGYKVYDAELISHFDASGNGISLNGVFRKLDLVHTDIQVDGDDARSIALKYVKARTRYYELNEATKTLLDYDGVEIHDTIWYSKDRKNLNYRLAYQIHIRPNVVEHWECFVDIATGDIIDAHTTTCHADGPKTANATDLNNVTRTLNTFEQAGKFYLYDASRPMFSAAASTGVIQTLDANNTYGDKLTTNNITSSNNTWSNKTAVSAHFNAGIAYEYYKNVHQRNSIDGSGGSIYSVINVADDDGGGLDNAFWNGKAMFYGNGRTAFKPLAAAIDVAGHEMTHGVVQSTANLEYQGESGAINESMADIFGCMMDSADWKMGEDVVKLTSFPSGALRDLSNPHNGGNSLGDAGYQPRHYNERYTGSQDNGGVHINSGIPNYAFYLYATALGSRHKASKVYYKALRDYLSKSSQFIDLRLSVLKAAKDIYGDGSTAVTEAAKAFDQVGILDGQATNTNEDLPINTGSEYLLLYNTAPADPVGMYLTPNGQNFTRITANENYNKPSVTDDGSMTVFVNADRKLRLLDMDPNASPKYSQYIIDSELEAFDWSNIAISKDGNRVAAISAYEDTSIYIIDLKTGAMNRFILYNPTFSSGIKSGGPVYADGLEWDYSGEYLVYDCFNTVKSLDGTNIEYWDINIIKVWDKTNNNFSTGETFKLISNLDPGESIGNPAISKTSNNIMAFDLEFVDPATKETSYFELGVNLETNDLKIIAENNYLGWPSFDKNDKKLAFTTKNGSDFDIDYVNLNADKISTSDQNFSPYISGAKWGVFYTFGKRVVGVQDDLATKTLANIEVYPNPVSGVLNIASNVDASAAELYDMMGRLVAKYNVVAQSIDISDVKQGYYLLKVNSGNNNFKAIIQKLD